MQTQDRRPAWLQNLVPQQPQQPANVSRGVPMATPGATHRPTPTGGQVNRPPMVTPGATARPQPPRQAPQSQQPRPQPPRQAPASQQPMPQQSSVARSEPVQSIAPIARRLPLRPTPPASAPTTDVIHDMPTDARMKLQDQGTGFYVDGKYYDKDDPRVGEAVNAAIEAGGEVRVATEAPVHSRVPMAPRPTSPIMRPGPPGPGELQEPPMPVDEIPAPQLPGLDRRPDWLRRLQRPEDADSRRIIPPGPVGSPPRARQDIRPDWLQRLQRPGDADNRRFDFRTQALSQAFNRR